jgi:hypothetical protein
MSAYDFKWSASEKNVVRAEFDRACAAELAELIANFKRKAAAIESADEMWSLGNSLSKTRLNFDFKYDFRYSQLIMVFARLCREGRISIEELEGLSDDKLKLIEGIATM